jgi:hypothetical protein
MKEAPGSSERRFLQAPHGVTSQKIPFFLVAAVKTSNLTEVNSYHLRTERNPCKTLRFSRGLI